MGGFNEPATIRHGHIYMGDWDPHALPYYIAYLMPLDHVVPRGLLSIGKMKFNMDRPIKN